VGDIDVHFFPVDSDRDIESFLRVQNLISRRASYSEDDEQTWLKNSVNSRALCEHLEIHGDRYDRIIAGPYLFGLTYHVSLLHPGKTMLVPCLHDEAFAYTRAFKAMFRNVRGHLFNTAPERDLAIRLYGLAAPACHVVGMGIDPFECDANAVAARHGLRVPYILYSGRREPLKGTPLLIAYFATYRARTGRDVRLVLTGSGEVEVPREVQPYVLDLGFVPERAKHDAMAGAVCFCHPSVNESLSIVLLESWLAGRPALVHARSAVMQDQCRRSGAGLWFQTYPEFEEELTLLLGDAGLSRAMGAAGRSFVRREYAWEAITARLFDALAG
jgi:glycosyltransferase involved in cell wall biosynthesis